ncbi:MAG: uncharacterized protein A8A55_3142 [Amphiamblys sp. WSBS2006]|nr:MAG: uncharacterized protein A8A55_3142 [Amphiamblys sp. WSBS2006]
MPSTLLSSSESGLFFYQDLTVFKYFREPSSDDRVYDFQTYSYQRDPPIVFWVSWASFFGTGTTSATFHFSGIFPSLQIFRKSSRRNPNSLLPGTAVLKNSGGVRSLPSDFQFLSFISARSSSHSSSSLFSTSVLTFFFSTGLSFQTSLHFEEPVLSL